MVLVDDLDKGGKRSWWGKRSKKQRILIVLPTVLFVFLMVVAISGSGSHHDSKDVTSPAVARELNETPQVVTISELYGHSVAEGAFVKVTGTVLESDWEYLRIANDEGKDIYIEGMDLRSYENEKVTVIGTFKGPGQYKTIKNATRTVPSIKGAKLV